MERECVRYSLDVERVARTVEGGDPLADERLARHWWELLVLAGAIVLFVWLATGTERPNLPMNKLWMSGILAGSAVMLVLCGVLLWKRTGFS